MPKPAAEKQKEYRERKRDQGLTEVRVWVPDTSRARKEVQVCAKRLRLDFKLRAKET